MTIYNKPLRIRRLYKCDNCLSYYENRKRAEHCHYGDVVVFSVSMIRLKDYKRRGDQRK